MRVTEQHFSSSTITSSIAILLLLLIGKSISTAPIIPFIVILGLFMFFVSFTSMDFAMILLILAMLLSPEISLGSVSTQRSIVVRLDDLFIFAFCLAWLARTAINSKLAIITKTPINRYIGFYIITFLIPTVWGMIMGNVSYTGGLFYVLKYIEYFIIFYLAAGNIKNKKQIKQYLMVFLLTFAIVNIYAFIQIGQGGRVSAPFEGKIGEPNTLGGYQILMLAVILGLLTHTRSLRWKWPLALLAMFTVIPFAFTLSRASYLAIIPMYITLILFNKGRTRNILIGVLIICVIALFFFFPDFVKDRITYTFIPEVQETITPVEIGSVTLGPSASARILDWIRLIKKWERKPFIGYGVTGVGFVDSQFIRVFVETGIIGLFAFFLLLINISRQSLKNYKTTKDDFYEGLALGFFAGNIGLIFHAITANTFILIRIMEPYWFLAAIIMLIPKIEAQEQKQRKENGQKEAIVKGQTISVAMRNSSFLLKRDYQQQIR